MLLALFAIVFETPLAAAAIAGGAVSVPIIIHLLNRRRFKVVVWAAMRFLLAAQRKNSRRMRIEQLLLLVVRCLVLLLLVLAMLAVTPWAEAVWRWANPSGGKALATGGQRTHKIIVVDGSFSMGLKTNNQTAFERARAMAEKLVLEGAGGDGFSVVLMAAPPRRIVAEPSENADKVAGEVRRLRLTHGNSDLEATFSTVASMLAATPGKFPAREVYFITDMQKASWTSRREEELKEALDVFKKEKARAIFIDVGQEGAQNFAVVDLKLSEPVATSGRPVAFLVTIRNFARPRKEDKEKPPSVNVRLFAGRARAKDADPKLDLGKLTQIGEKTIKVEPGAQTVSFAHRFPATGDYVVQARINQGAPDAQELDDVRSAIVSVKDKVPVMLVNGKPAPLAFDRATEWLRMALFPYEEGEQVPASVTPRPRVVSPAQFAVENFANLADYDCVFLCDVPRFTSVEAGRLEAHVRRGGSVVFCMGDNVDFGAYNELFFKRGAELMPARLVGKQPASASSIYRFALGSEGDREPPLKAFAAPGAREHLLSPRIARFVTVEAPSAARGIGVPRTILSLVRESVPGVSPKAEDAKMAPGGPAILEWRPPLTAVERAVTGNEKGRAVPRMRGRVVLITMTVNADWNNWPPSRAYPPLMNELLDFATAARLREQAFAVGEPIELFLPASASKAHAVLELPRDPLEKPEDRRDDLTRKVPAQPLGDSNVLRWTGTDVRGVYKLTVGQDPREHLFAVNVPAHGDDPQDSESDPERTTAEKLQATCKEIDLQVVSDLGEIKRRALGEGETAEIVHVPQGPPLARYFLLAVLALVLFEVVLAWQFGHYSSASAVGAEGVRPLVGAKRWAMIAAPIVLFGALAVVGFVLLHDAVTGDFLRFLPEWARSLVERAMGVPPPAPGEGSHWRLEYRSYFWDAKSDPWLVGGLAVLATALVVAIYANEGQKQGIGFRTLLVTLRLGLLFLVLGVFLPQVQLHFERQGWPDVVILIDDSQSMSALDSFRDERVKKYADELAAKGKLSEETDLKKEKDALEDELHGLEKGGTTLPREKEERLALVRAELDERKRLDDALSRRIDLTPAERLRLIKALLTRGPQGDWLTQLLSKRKVRVHVYRCASKAHRVASLTESKDVEKGLAELNKLEASNTHNSSQLGAAVRQVLNDFRGSSLSAIVMLTDGVTTEGEDLLKVSKHAAQQGVPLYFVGVGDAQELRDVYLHDLTMPDAVLVNDRVIMDLKITAQGYTEPLDVPVTLSVRGTLRKKLGRADLTPDERARADSGKLKADDKGLFEVEREKPETRLVTKVVRVSPGKTEKISFEHQAAEAGEFAYEMRAAEQAGEVKKDNNKIERAVSVREPDPIKVLYVEGYRRYEYHYLKTLLGRESDRIKGNKSITLKVWLQDADKEFAEQEKHALPDFPNKEELMRYNVVILGDVDPAPDGENRMKEHLRDLAEFVEKGGGLLMLAGERFSPRAYRNSPLKNVMPIDVAPGAEDEDDGGIVESYRPELTPIGQLHPIFRFHTDEKESAEVWGRLKELFWYSTGYEPKRAAEVLAIHPKAKASGKRGEAGERQPLVVQQFVGAGRVMFFGFNETWRWNWREDQLQYNEFWLRTVRYLGIKRQGRVDLRLDRQGEYRRGDPIKITVRFPDDAPAPPTDTKVKVLVERRPLGRAGDASVSSIEVGHLTGSRASYEALLTQTPVGEYKFYLTRPTVPSPQPRAECKVLPPPGEMEQVRMNQPEMEQAAAESRGKFYLLPDADRLIDELPAGNRVTVRAPGAPSILWNSILLFLLALGLLTTEWLLRKQKNLL